MEKITVKKAELLEILRKNRTTHKGVFEKALEGYKAEALRLFEDQIARIKSGKPFKGQWALTVPVDQTADYDRAILMLEMSVDDTVALSENDFKSYVQDQWGWKSMWATTNKMYTPEAMWSGENATL